MRARIISVLFRLESMNSTLFRQDDARQTWLVARYRRDGTYDLYVFIFLRFRICIAEYKVLLYDVSQTSFLALVRVCGPAKRRSLSLIVVV